DAVEFCCESALRRGRLRELLGDVPDIERLMSRIVAGSALPRELLGLRRGLEAVPALRAALGADAPHKRARRDGGEPEAASAPHATDGSFADDAVTRGPMDGVEQHLEDVETFGDAGTFDARIADISARI